MTDDRMETITDPAEIRATDDPDERTTPAPVGAAVALDLDAARAMLNAANTIKATGGAVEIGGVRIEPCDEYGSTVTTARAEAAEAEVGTLRARLAAVEALHWEVEGKCAHCRDCYHDDYLAWPCPTAAALASSPTPSETGEGEHVAREVFTADGIPFVRCSCSTAKSPTSHRWLSEHVPNGGVAELQAVVKRQAEGAKA